MGLDVTLHMPPDRFVRVEADGEPHVYQSSSHHDAKALSRLFWDQAEVELIRDMSNEELREAADAIAAVEYDPSFADEYHVVSDREDFERIVTRFQAYAAAGGTLTASH